MKQLLGAKTLPTEELLAICAQTADGLSAVHRMRIVHRDIKPANIFIVEGGLVKILNFALACYSTLVNEDNTAVTVQRGPVGTIGRPEAVNDIETPRVKELESRGGRSS